MTGRDLIIYILENGLEDEPVFKDGHILGFITVYEAAAKLQVGAATIRVLIAQGDLEAVRIGGEYFIPSNSAYFKEK